MSDTDQGQGTQRWQLPPTPGQYGYKPPPEPPSQTPASSDAEGAPYGFRRMEPIGVGPYTPYIPTGQNPALRDRPPSEWGMDDWVLRGMRAPGGTPQGMYVPQERDLPSIFHNVTSQWGRWAPPSIGMPAIAGGQFYGTAMQLYAKGAVQQARIAQTNALQSYKIAQERYKEMIGKYSNVYAQFAGSGKDDPGEPEQLHEALMGIAREYGDRNMIGLLDRGDYGAVDKLLKHLDHNSQDLGKALKAIEIQIAQERLKKLQDEARARAGALDIYRQPSGTGVGAARSAGATLPGTPAPGPAPAGMPEGVGSPNQMGAPPAGADTNPSVDLGSTPLGDKPDTREPDADVPAAPKEDQPAAQPSEDAGDTTPPDDQAAAQPEAGEQPTRLAEADTGVTSDIGAPAGAAPQAPTPPVTDLTAQAKRRGAPVMAMDDEAQAAPARRPAEAAPPPAPDFRTRPSAALNAAHKAGFYNDDTINGLALSDVNGTMKIQQARDIPKEIRPFVIGRSQEMAAEFRRILQDPNITGEQVYAEIAKFNPEFAATLKGYVNGDLPPPQSAWQNAAYRDRIVGLGHKADNGFTYLTFANRKSTLAKFSGGQEGRTVTAINTAYDHGQTLLNTLRHRPGLLARMFGGIAGIGPLVSPNPVDRQIMGALQNEINTFNNEYESALARGGRATVSARGEQQHELPLVLGDYATMEGNILSKLGELQKRAGEMQDQFHAGTGFQPAAMDRWLGEVTGDSRRAVGEMKRMENMINARPATAGPDYRRRGQRGSGGWNVERLP